MTEHDPSWPPASPPARTDTRTPAARTSRDQESVTHHVVIGAGAADLEHQPGEDEHQDSRLVETLAGLRFVSESPGCLRDQIKYARDGAYTIRQDGAWRNANIWFARLIAAPGLTVCYLLAWALFTRLSRALIAWPVLLLILWLLNSLPVTAWLIPDGWDFTTWPSAIAEWFSAPDPSIAPGQGE